jgi:predicted RNase H-like HicB family nuclease
MKKPLTRIVEKHGVWYLAYVREFPGVITQGQTRKSATGNLKEALALVVLANRELATRRRSGTAV